MWCWAESASHLWGERVLGQEPANTKPTRDQVVNDLTQQLQLTPDQQKQVAAMIDDTRTKWQALYAPLDAPRETDPAAGPCQHSGSPDAGAAAQIR